VQHNWTGKNSSECHSDSCSLVTACVCDVIIVTSHCLCHTLKEFAFKPLYTNVSSALENFAAQWNVNDYMLCDKFVINLQILIIWYRHCEPLYGQYFYVFTVITCNYAINAVNQYYAALFSVKIIGWNYKYLSLGA